MTTLTKEEKAERRANAVMQQSAIFAEDAKEAATNMIETFRALSKTHHRAFIVPSIGKDGIVEYEVNHLVTDEHFTSVHILMLALCACGKMDEFLDSFYNKILPAFYAGIKSRNLPVFKVIF